MARRIKFSAECYKCKALKGPGEAWLTRMVVGGIAMWKCQCDDCYNVIKNKTAEPSDKVQPSASSAVKGGEGVTPL